MSNVIKIKGKTTSGAPSLTDLSVREMCFVLPDNAFYIKKDASTMVGPFVVNLATGDMLKSTYDTNNDGVVDSATNALSLGGAAASSYMLKSTYDSNGDGVVDSATNSLALGGVSAASYATQTYVNSQISALVASAPGALDTLNELASALGNDANFAATVNSSLSSKLDSSSTIDGGTF